MFFLYKYRCDMLLKGWIFFTIIMVLFTLTAAFVTNIIKYFNWAVDIISFCLFIWNFGAVGVMACLWCAPKKLNQFYLIVVGVLMALVFITFLPEWTTWAVLGVISVWDLIAVLCKYGPLRMLVEEAQERGNTEILPALIYSAMAYEERPRPDRQGEQTPLSEDEKSHSASQTSSPEIRRPQRADVSANGPRADSEDDEQTGVKLGLGDFIFYSVLCGKAAVLGDWSV